MVTMMNWITAIGLNPRCRILIIRQTKDPRNTIGYKGNHRHKPVLERFHYLYLKDSIVVEVNLVEVNLNPPIDPPPWLQ
jgi:hypothetical protein